MKRHKRMNRRMTNRLKSTVSVLLASSMVLNPLNGIQIAIGSELNSTRVTVKGSKADINLSSAALREAATYAIQNGVTYTPEAYVGLDTATDAAFENLLTQGGSLYELELFDAEDQEVFSEAGIDVKLLVQKDPKAEDAELDTASASNLKRKTNVSFDYQAKSNKGKEILFYQKESPLDSLIGNFMLEDINHADLTEAEIAADDSSYELTGSETVTILYMNTAKDKHSFSLSVDGKAFSGSVTVEGNESAVSKLKKQLKKTAKEELTGTTEATAEVTETAAEETTKADTTETAAEDQDNAVTTEAATTAEETTTAADSTAETEETTTTEAATEAATTKAEAQTEELSQEETAKEAETQAEKKDKAEDVTKEVEQLTSSTVTAIGSFTLQSFFDEPESQEVQTAEAEPTEAEEAVTEAATEAEKQTEASEEETTAEETTAAESEKETTAEETKADTETTGETTAAEESTAAETEESKTTETKAITAMDESLAEERNKLLSEQTVEALAENTVSAKAVQYTLDDLTSDFKSVDLGAYLVKVYPVADNAIEADWTLKATELLKEEQTEADAKTATAETMSTETADALKNAGIYDDSVSLDIHFEDADGKEVEPKGKVRVEIEVAKEALDETATSLSVYHVEEKADGSVKEVKALDTTTKALDQNGDTIANSKATVTETVENTEAVAAVSETDDKTTTKTPAAETVKKFSDEVEKVKVGFVTDSFSVYTITAESGKNPIKVTIHHVDIETKKKIADVDNTVTTWYADTTENNYRSKLKDALLIYKKEDFETSSGAKYKYYGSSLDNAESEETKKVAEQWKTWCENYVKDNSDLANGTLELNLYYQDQTTKDVVFHPTFFDYYVDTKHGADASVYLTKGTTYTAKEWSGRGWTYPTKTIEKNGWYYENTEQASYWNGWTASYTYTLVADGYGSINSSSNYKNTGTHFEVGGKPDYGNYGNYEVNEHTSDNPIVSGIITGLSGTENETVEFAYNAPDLFSKYQYNSDAEHRVAGKVIYEGENYKITFKKTGDKYVYDEKNDGYNALAFFPLDNKTNGAGQESMKDNRWNMDTGGCGNSQKNNCFFGMRFDAEFTIPEDYDKSKTNFTFEGDDDMWVFVDGERVLDLGGIHYPYPLANEKYRDTHNISLKDTYDYYKDDYVEGHKNTINFSDLGYNNGEKHQLTILYMERGGYDSHCHMEFVLPNLVPSDNVITKEDKYPITLTKNVSGIENLQNYSTSFSIYKAEDVENGAPKTGAVAVKTAKVDTFTKTKGSDVYTGNAAGQVKLPDGNYVIIEMPAAVDGYELTKVTGGSSEDDIKDTRAYSFTVNGENTYSVAFTNTYQRTTKTVSVTKSWSGRNQPNDVEAVIGLEQTVNGSTTTVQKNGTNWTQKAEYSADGTTVAFEGLPIKDSSGNVITYTAKELGIKVGGTTYTPDSNGVTIIKNGNTPTGYYTATTVTNTNGSVSITNTWTPVYRLTVKKTVTGSGAVVEESGYTFDLGITVEGSTVNEDLVKSLNGWDTYKTTVNVIPTGIAASEKGHTDVYLPAGYKYQVKEIKSNCEKYTTTITDGSGNEIAKEDNASEKYTIMANVATLNANATVSFTNTYNIPAPTGIHRDILPYVISMGIALAGAAMLLLEMQRKRRLSR